MTFSGASILRNFPAIILSSFLLYSCNLITGNFSGDAEDLISYLSDTLGIDDCLAGTQIVESDLPANAQSYLQSTYPQDSASEVYLFEVGSDTTYQTYLASGTIVLFDSQGSLVAEGNPEILDGEDLDDFVSDFLEQQYPGIDLDEVDDFDIYSLPSGGFLLAAVIDDTELLVELDGSSICYELALDVDDDGDDNDYGYDCLSKDSLSASVYSLLTTYYSNYEIEEITCDSLCDGTQGFWVELEDEQGNDDEEVYLFFDLNDNLLIEAAEIELNDVPQVVIDAAKQSYQELEDDVMIWTLGSGAIEYGFEVEDEDDEFLASFDDTGAFICEWVSVDED